MIPNSLLLTLLAFLCLPAAAVNTTDPPAPPPPSGGVNFVIQNQHPANLSFFYTSGPGVTPIDAPTEIADNETLTAVFPPGWQGNIQVVEAGKNGDYSQASWMEGNTVNGQVWQDVSYVRGFSVSIVCSCLQPDNTTRISGCNKNLWASNSACPNKGGQANVTCPNTSKDNGPAQKWFDPCTKLAYTFPNDIPNYRCAPGVPVECCIGDTCARPANPPGVGENGANGMLKPGWWLNVLATVVCLGAILDWL